MLSLSLGDPYRRKAWNRRLRLRASHAEGEPPVAGYAPPNQRARRLEPNCCFSARARPTARGRRRSASGRRGSRCRPAPIRPRAELDVAGAAAVVEASGSAAPQLARSAARRRASRRPRRTRPPSGRPGRDVAHRVDAGVPRRQRAPTRPGRSRSRSCRLRSPRRGRGAWARPGRGRTASRCRRRAPPRCAPGRASSRGGRRRTRCRAPRTPSSSAREVSGEGGTGVPSGITSVDLAVARARRARGSSRAAAGRTRWARAGT